MTSYRCFDVTVADKVGHVVLSRGDELNTMVPEFWRDLPEIVTGLSDSGEVRAVVISSHRRHFSAGMDLSVFTGGGLAHDEAWRPAAGTRQHAAARAAAAALVHRPGEGPRAGARRRAGRGDRRRRRPGHRLRHALRQRGRLLLRAGDQHRHDRRRRHPAAPGQGRPRGRRPRARLHRPPDERPSAPTRSAWCRRSIADHESLVAGVLEIAREIAAKSPLAIWGTKVAMNYARDHSVDDGLEQIATWQAGMFQPADMAEAFTAKAEKRDARSSPTCPRCPPASDPRPGSAPRLLAVRHPTPRSRCANASEGGDWGHGPSPGSALRDLRAPLRLRGAGRPHPPVPR